MKHEYTVLLFQFVLSSCMDQGEYVQSRADGKNGTEKTGRPRITTTKKTQMLSYK